MRFHALRRLLCWLGYHIACEHARRQGMHPLDIELAALRLRQRRVQTELQRWDRHIQRRRRT